MMADEPTHGFADSRRLPGPNRDFGAAAVTLTPLGSAATNPAAAEAWAGYVRATAAALGWTDPEPRIRRHAGGTTLLFRAPPDLLLTATDLNEWAWERAAADCGDTGFDRAQDLGPDPVPALRARAESERLARLEALRRAAASRGVALVEDDALVSLGTGAGSRVWPRNDLPAVDRVPWQDLYDVPTVLVTGSNGKTTTVRVLAAIAAAAGLTPGLSSTEGVVIGGDVVLRGDYSGPDGARTVLRDARVGAAILETARGGILRRGLAVARAGAAIVTNISADHLGEYGVDRAADLAETKLAVAFAVADGGTLVLNAADETLMSAVARLPHAAAAYRAGFAPDHEHPELERLRAAGGTTCGVRGGELLLSHRGVEHDLGAVAAMPLNVGGAAPYNVANLAAAALAAVALDWPVSAVRATLERFGAHPDDNVGRLERRRHRGAHVLIDYAHNPDALSNLLRVARALAPRRLLLLLGQAGNRSDGAIADLVRTAVSFAPDRVVVKELAAMLRGRAPGEVPALILRELIAAGLPSERIALEFDEEAAAGLLLDEAQAGDVIVLPIHTAAVRDRLAARLRPTAASP
jgi:UDP-N-acetylmuramyl tripeptide synthase